MRWAEHALAFLGLCFLALIFYTWIEMKSDEKRGAAYGGTPAP